MLKYERCSEQILKTTGEKAASRTGAAQGLLTTAQQHLRCSEQEILDFRLSIPTFLGTCFGFRTAASISIKQQIILHYIHMSSTQKTEEAAGILRA